MTFSRLQSVFSLGELDPRLNARADWEGFLKGMQLLRNMLVIPQGGISKRFGTIFKAEITDVPSDDDVKLILFQIGADTLYQVVFKPLVILIYDNGALIATVVSPYQMGEIADLRFAQDAKTLTIAHPNYPPKILYYSSLLPPTFILQNIAFKNLPVYDFVGGYETKTFTFVLVAGGTPGVASYGKEVTVTASAAVFTSEHVGGVIIVSSMNLRIDLYTSSTVVRARVILAPFQDISVATGADILIAMPAWSATRGWPMSVTFFQNRLVFGGTFSLPEMLNLSRIGTFTDFNEWDGSASAAITVFARGERAHNIRYVKGAQSLIIFTINGPYSTPLLTDAGITSENIALNQQAKNNIANVDPQLLDDQVIFVDKGGKIIRSLQYTIQAGKYVASNITILSSHLINDPVDATTYSSDAANDGEFLFLVNGDGTLAIYQSMQEENIEAWTLSDTDGDFVRCSAIAEDGYFITRRIINGISKYYLERIDPTVYVDCQLQNVFVPPQTVFNGFDTLEGKTVEVVADGIYVGDQVVTGGQITLSIAASTVEIGLPISPRIKQMPINIDLQTGPLLYQNKRINTIWIDYYNSLGVEVDGVKIPFIPYGDVGEIPVPQSDFFKYTPMRGFDPLDMFEITQKGPYPFTLRGIGTLVDIN